MKRSALKRTPYQWKRSALKRGKRIKPIGKKGADWIAVRRKLKIQYEAAGITTCELRYEGCRVDTWLSFAHGRKRRHLQCDELETLTILCCTPCHDRIERLPESEMCAVVKSVIAERELAA